MKKIVTHNSTFHADEVSAIALLKVFNPEECFIVERVPHATTVFKDADYVIDVGREYDNVTRFDHHQWRGGLSSAGLIWNHLGVQEQYPEISKLVEAIDHNDVGVRPAGDHEYSRLVSLYNHTHVHESGQRAAFDKAVDFAYDIFAALKDNQELIDKAFAACKDAELWPGTTDVLYIGDYHLGWEKVVNGQTRPEIGAVVWYDAELDTWNIQTTRKAIDTYEKVGKQLLPWSSMNFVHSSNFFAVAATKGLMDEYIKNHRA